MAAELGDFQLGPFQVLPSQSLVRRFPDEGHERPTDTHVEPKVMAVLERLAQQPLQVVSRSTLLEDVWSGTVVTEEVVTRCISELRTALGDSSRSPTYIQTIPKKGYKLLQRPQAIRDPLLDGGPLAQPDRPQNTETTGGIEAGLQSGAESAPGQSQKPPQTDSGAMPSSPVGAIAPGNNSASPPAAPAALSTPVALIEPAAKSATTASNSGPAGTSRRPRLLWALVATVVIAIGLGTALIMQQQETELAPGATAGLANLEATADTTPGIAILPFATLDDGAESNYFGAGLAEELLNALVNVPGLRVVSRYATAGAQQSSSDSPVDIPNIARTLGVNAVLTGSVRRMNNDVRVTAQLINGNDGVHMWADQFDGDLGDVFRIQDEIAAAIVGALRLQLTEPIRVARISADMNALDYYLLGRHHWHQRTAESLTRAIELFQRAVRVDPDMAIAYSGLADAYLLLADYGDMPHEEATALARPAIERALALDNTLAEAHASQGMLYLSEGETKLADQALRNAIRLNPGYHMAHMWLGSTVAMHGNVKEAHKFYLKAYRLDPLHPVINQNVAMSFATLGDYESAKRVIEKLDPRFDTGGRLNHLRLYLAQQLGDFDAVRELATQQLGGERVHDRMAGYLALWNMHTRLGEDQAAGKYLEQARAEEIVDFEFRLQVGRKLAREGAAADFAALMQEAPESFHEKAALEIRTLEGMLLIATENQSKAASVLESAMTKLSKKRHPASELLAISHLLYVYQQTGNDERYDYWLKMGSKVIYDAIDSGYGQLEFITEVAFFHAAAGQSEEAAKAFWHALSMGKLAPWEITDDIRISRIQKSPELQPVVQSAARGWTA